MSFQYLWSVFESFTSNDLFRRTVPFTAYLISIILSRKFKKQMVPPISMGLCMYTQLMYAFFTYRPAKPSGYSLESLGGFLLNELYEMFFGNQPIKRFQYISIFSLNFSLIAALLRSTNLNQKMIAFFDLVLSQFSMFVLFLNTNLFFLPLIAAFLIHIFLWMKEYRALKQNPFTKKKTFLVSLGMVLIVIASILQHCSQRESYDDIQITANSIFPISITLLLLTSKKLKKPPFFLKKIFKCCKTRRKKDKPCNSVKIELKGLQPV